MHPSPQVSGIQMSLKPGSSIYSREDLGRQTKIYNLEIIKFHKNGDSLRKMSQLFLEAYSHNRKCIKVNSTGAPEADSLGNCLKCSISEKEYQSLLPVIK